MIKPDKLGKIVFQASGNRLSCLDESQFSKLFGAPTAGVGVVRVALGLFRLF